MKATTEQRAKIEGILKNAGIYNEVLLPFNPETRVVGDCTSVYIDGEIPFDTMAEIVDCLRGEKVAESGLS